MIEIQLFGWLLATLPSATSLVLVLVSLSSVTYLATTLLPVLRAGPAALRGARALGLATAAVALGAVLLGVRVGAAGAGGELVPTLALGVVAAAACGSTAALALLGTGAAAARLGAAGARRRAGRLGARAEEQRRLAASQRAFFDGDDLHAEVLGAEAALGRLATLLDKLAITQQQLDDRLAELDQGAAAGDLGRELRRTRDEVATRLDLGRRIHTSAAATAFRLSCSAPLRRLLRRRPRDLTRGLTPDMDAATATARIGAAVAAIDELLHEADAARSALAALEGRRPAPDDAADPDEVPEDAWGLAMRDLASIEDAYEAVQERLAVVVVRFSARADMEAVAVAAGEVSDQARASGIPASDLQDLVDEVTRAESAIRMATPPELDARVLSDVLARSATALGGRDGASLDELLRALREVG